MSMNPWLMEQMVAGRMEEVERTALGGRSALAVDRPAPSRRHPRGNVTHHLGALLITVGRRLADVDSFPAAFDGTHRS
jgi:hypothetical protein